MIAPVVNSENKVTGVLRFDDFPSVNRIRHKTVAVLGLGYVGLTLSLVLAENGFSVTGLDRDGALIDKLKKRSQPSMSMVWKTCCRRMLMDYLTQ